MRDTDSFGRAFERMALYMLGILIGSFVGFTYAAIAGGALVGPRASLTTGILGALFGGWFAWRFIRDFSP
jgi:hypothetical protein